MKRTGCWIEAPEVDLGRRERVFYPAINVRGLASVRGESVAEREAWQPHRPSPKRNEAIYYILKPALFISKYIGIFPLPDVYEPFLWIDRSIRQIVFDRAIPVVAILWLIFVGYVIGQMLIYDTSKTTRKGVDYYAGLLTNIANVLMVWIPTVSSYFRKDRMSDYLKQFADVNDLLARRKFLTRRRIIVVYALLFCMHVGKTYTWILAIGEIEAPDLVSHETDTWGSLTPLVRPVFFVGLLIFTLAEIQTQVSYFAVVSAIGAGLKSIKSALKEIRKSSDQMTSLSPPLKHVSIGGAGKDDAEKIAHKLRDLRRQHVVLVQLGRSLDELFSPMLFTMFVFEAMTTSVILFQLINVDQHLSLMLTIGIAFYGSAPFAVMMTVCTCADKTTKSGSEIASVIFSSDLTANCACKDEMNLFALQLNVYQVLFTASGFFPINHALAGTIVGIACTYTVVMIQLRDVEETV